MPDHILDTQISQKVLEYLEQHSDSCLVILDDQQHIKHCNKAFLSIVGLQDVPVGINIANYLLDQGSFSKGDPLHSGFRRMHFTLINIKQNQYNMTGFFTPITDGYLLICEKTWIAEDDIFQEISKINNQLANMTRELNKKNIALEKAQDNLTLQKERLLNIVQGANVGTWEWNVQTGEHIINERWAEIIGYTLDELTPATIDTWTKHCHPDDLEMRNRELVKHYTAEADFYNIECRMRHKDSHWVWVNDCGKVISWTEDGKPLWVFGILSDINERKKTEEALKLQARERAAVDTFTNSVSNDLQAPLRRIEGFSEALLEECPEQLNEQARGYLTRIITQIGRMKELTDALLQLSNVVSREIDREAVNLSALVRSNLEKLQYRDPERRVETIVAPELIVEGDTDLLDIMLRHLVDNAWKFTFGVQKARIECGSTEQGGRTVYYLKDNGVGFDMNYADKLFAPFHKLHSEDKYPGIGIGLNLVFRIITRHGGEIWAEGAVGRGACFYFTLP